MQPCLQHGPSSLSNIVFISYCVQHTAILEIGLTKTHMRTTEHVAPMEDDRLTLHRARFTGLLPPQPICLSVIPFGLRGMSQVVIKGLDFEEQAGPLLWLHRSKFPSFTGINAIRYYLRMLRMELYCDGYFKGSTNADVFKDFIEQLLQHCNRWPEPKSVLIMDNASSHHTVKNQQLCSDSGVKLIVISLTLFTGFEPYRGVLLRDKAVHQAKVEWVWSEPKPKFLYLSWVVCWYDWIKSIYQVRMVIFEMQV